MKYIVYNSVAEADFRTAEHTNVIHDYVTKFKQDSNVNPSMINSGSSDLNLAEFNYEDLSTMHFHYSNKNNGASIEKSGLISQIGANSEGIDSEEAIYFSVGLPAVLHNWDVWLKWRANRFNNPNAAGAKVGKEVSRDAWKLGVAWMKYMSSKAYRNDDSVIAPVFEYEKTELERSDYYALTITPGIDYPKEQFDEKKAFIAGSGYAEEIYGVGVSTDLSNTLAEQWNRYTELGKKAHISADKVFRLTVYGCNDALSVLGFLYRRYINHCVRTGEKIAQFALLPRFLEYCGQI